MLAYKKEWINQKMSIIRRFIYIIFYKTKKSIKINDMQNKEKSKFTKKKHERTVTISRNRKLKQI